VPSPNGSSVGAKLTKASIDLRRGGVSVPDIGELIDLVSGIAMG